MPEPPPGPLKRGGLFNLALGGALGTGIITLLPTAIQSAGTVGGWVFVLSVPIAYLLYNLPYITVCSHVRLHGGFVSLMGGVTKDKSPLWSGAFSVLTILTPFVLTNYAVGMGLYVNAIIPSLSPVIIGFVTLTLFYIIQVLGVKVISWISNIMLPILIVGIVLFITMGFRYVDWSVVFNSSSPNWNPTGFSGILIAWMVALNAGGAHDMAVFFGREANRPRKDIPWVCTVVALVMIVVFGFFAVIAMGIVPPAELGYTLVSVARMIMPGWLFILWVITVPIMLLLTTLNAVMFQWTNNLVKICEEGWFPKELAKRNKYGSPWRLLTLVYFICIGPVIFGISVAQVFSIMSIFSMLYIVMLGINLFRFPKLYGDGWKKAAWHVPNTLFYILCSTHIAYRLLAFAAGAMNLGWRIPVISLIFMGLLILWAYYRLKTNKAMQIISCWPGEDTITPKET